MGMLPFATRNLAETMIWTGLVLFILARASGIDTMTLVQMNSEKAHGYLQILVNSPYCFAYEERLIQEKTNSTGAVLSVDEEFIVRTGMIDITKFYDSRYQNCMRNMGIWDSKSDLALEDGEVQTCGWSIHSGFFLGDIDPNDDCEQGYDCVGGVCVETSCLNDEGDPVNCGIQESLGQFLVYNLTLKDEVTGQKYNIMSYEQGTKQIYKPLTIYDEYEDEEWADSYQMEYMTCSSDFGGEIITSQTPVIIAYPATEGITQHYGVLSIELCRGTYGDPLEGI